MVVIVRLENCKSVGWWRRQSRCRQEAEGSNVDIGSVSSCRASFPISHDANQGRN